MSKTIPSTNDVRTAFLEFFRKAEHLVLPSSPLVPHNDPTLMFTNAGMVQFKNIFTGAEKAPAPRVVTSQKCVRAGGKHNDLDNVGYTARHHTFFEMLGNFSFGDYFKEGAIDLAWELLTKGYGLKPEKLCVTVSDGDDVAWNYWKKLTGFADHKIIRLPGDENFWSMGDTGPCGFISEIFYDHGEGIQGGPPGSADADGDRFIEIWNLVFMQYDQVTPEKRIDLPKPSIDTGMGLERITAVLQGVHDNYDIDLFKALIAASERESRNSQPATRNSHRVIADHLRASCFLIADGVLPSNEGRGYVLRRIMRRAMRHAHQLGCKDPLMYRLVPALVQEMGDAYPELKRAQAAITDTLKTEEERFKQMLERGLKLLDEEIVSSCGTRSVSTGSKVAEDPAQPLRISQDDKLFSGEAAFKLYDTYGFPLDLTQDILRGRNITVDIKAFDAAMEKQKDMARAAWSGSGEKATSRLWFDLKDKIGLTEFLGYTQEQASGKLIGIVANESPVQEIQSGEAWLIFNQTPFYGESGGQVGDAGLVIPAKAGIHTTPASNLEVTGIPGMDPGLRRDDIIAEVIDTQKPLENFILHKVRVLQKLQLGDELQLVVDAPRRARIRANHSATHLLHAALRKQLGEHVTQKGSLVAPDKLRFDFSHGKALTREELAAVETKVNAVIWRDTPVGCKIMAPEEAIKAGAMALFGEKYGDEVRVLSMGEDDGKNYSTELCGGTHVHSTGEIGMFKITGEGSVASGVRRIEAVTKEGVRDYVIGELTKQHAQLKKLEEENLRLRDELAAMQQKPSSPAQAPTTFSTDTLKSIAPKELLDLYEKESAALATRIEALQDDNKKLNKTLAEAKKQMVLGNSGNVTPEKIGEFEFIAQSFDDVPPKDLRGLAENFLKQLSSGVVVVASSFEGKASFVVAVSPAIISRFSAVDLIKYAVEAVGGKGGGGRPDMAQGGGPNAGNIAAAMTAIKNALQR